MGRKNRNRNRDRSLALIPTGGEEGTGLKKVDKPEPPAPIKPKHFELIVEQAGEAHAATRVRWCLKPAGLDAIKEKRLVHPHLLLVSYREEGEGKEARLTREERQLLPLDQGFALLQFHTPGKHQLFAAIVYKYDEADYKSAWNTLYELYLSKDKDNRFRLVLNNRLSFREDMLRSNLPTVENVTVTVSEEFFAPERNPLLMAYVNFCFSQKPVDECSYWRRGIFAFSLQIPGAILYFLWKIISRIGACIGMTLATYRYIDWSCIIHPYAMTIADASAKRGMLEPPDDNTDFFCLSKRDGTERPAWQWLLLSPIFWLLLGGSTYSYIHYTKIMTFILSIIAIIIVAVIILAGADMISKKYKGSKWWAQRQGKAAQRAREKEDEDRREKARALEAARTAYYAKRLQPLICDGCDTPPAATLESLPESHRNIKVWKLDKKARSCRPFKQ